MLCVVASARRSTNGDAAQLIGAVNVLLGMSLARNAAVGKIT
jgi:hypothetical protein